jgi:hypothetical protein
VCYAQLVALMIGSVASLLEQNPGRPLFSELLSGVRLLRLVAH